MNGQQLAIWYTGAEGDETDLYPTNQQRTPRLKSVFETEIVDFGQANIEPLDQDHILVIFEDMQGPVLPGLSAGGAPGTSEVKGMTPS